MDYVLDLTTLDGLALGEPREDAERLARAALEPDLLPIGGLANFGSDAAVHTT